MRIRRLWRATFVMAAIAMAILVDTRGAAAQSRTAAYGWVETDSERFSIFLAGISSHPSDAGFVPAVGLLVYRLDAQYRGGRARLKAVNPSAGLRYQRAAMAGEVSLGYLFLTGNSDRAFGAPPGTSEGLVASALGEYIEAKRALEVRASYNGADRYFWGRGRATQQIVALDGGATVRIGGEGLGQWGAEFSPSGYKTLQAGGLVELRPDASWRLTGAVGAKIDNIPDRPHYFPYFKFELSVSR